MTGRFIESLEQELKAVKKGADPTLDLAMLMQRTGLDAVCPDKKGLGERVLEADDKKLSGLLKIWHKLKFASLVGDLIEDVVTRRANPGQELLATRLVAFQMLRRNYSCPFENYLMFKVISGRPDLLDLASDELTAQSRAPYLALGNMNRAIPFLG